MTTRTAWQQILVTPEELHQEETVQQLYERVQLRLRKEALLERATAKLHAEFNKLVVNHCLHLVESRHIFKTGRPDSAWMTCNDCGASVDAEVQTHGSRLMVVYRYSTPFFVDNMVPYDLNKTITISSSSRTFNGQYDIVELRPKDSTTITVSGMIMKSEGDV